MKRDDLLAGLASRRVSAPRRPESLQQCFEIVRRPRRIGSLGEILERLRNPHRARHGAAVVRIGGDDRRDRQVLERREARFDLHPLASVPLDELMATPLAQAAHRLCETSK